MEIVGKERLRDFKTKHPLSRRPLDKWVKVIENGVWKHFSELKLAFRSVDYVEGFLVFDIKGNDFRVITIAVFRNQQMVIKHVFTHQEYDWWNVQRSKKDRRTKHERHNELQ